MTHNAKTFFEAIRAGDRDRVRTILVEDPELLKARDENGLGPYTVAKYSRQDGIASLLLGAGAELDLFAACMAGAKDRVTELLSADKGLVNGRSHDGWTPLHIAAFFNQPEIAELLLASGADVHARSTNAMQNAPLHAAVAGRSQRVAEMLVAAGANLDARQHGGWTPLHGAAQSGDAELVKLLLSRGADRQARADNNQSAMDLALTKGHQAVVDLLEKSE